MKIKTITIHNYRGILDATFSAYDYSLIVGANNSGKTTIADAIRCFYEKDSFKFDKTKDFPRGIHTTDSDSWIEITFLLTDHEHESLKQDYQTQDNTLRLRKYFLPFGSRKPGIYQVSPDGTVSGDMFYGAKNVQEGKVGNLIYIPAISKVDDITKLTGPSALRDMLNGIMGAVVEKSEAYHNLSSSIDKFAEAIQDLKTADNLSLEGFQDEINSLLAPWKTQFSLEMNAPSSGEIIKNMISWGLSDLGLPGQKETEVDIDRFGSGFQRFFIYSLVRLSAKYIPRNSNTKPKDFQPDFTLVLFEEPEAYLHPEQQEELARELKRMGSTDNWQVLCTTHSPHFVSRSMDDIPTLVRVQKDSGIVHVFQIDESKLSEMFSSNVDYGSFFDNLPEKKQPKDHDLNLEALKYSMWISPERAALFFATNVLLVEGASEVVFITRLVSDGKVRLPMGTHVVDCFGKFNVHRFILLLDGLGITHSVLHDKDNDDNEEQVAWNAFLQSKKAGRTRQIKCLENDLEGFLGIDKPTEKSRKPLSILMKYVNGEIDEQHISKFAQTIESLFSATTGNQSNGTGENENG